MFRKQSNNVISRSQSCKNGTLIVQAAKLHKRSTVGNQRRFGSSRREFSQRRRNAQGGTAAEEIAALPAGALKLQKQTVNLNTAMFSSQSVNPQHQCRT